MATVFVQYSDAGKTRVVSSCVNPQSDDLWPFQGEVDEGDLLYAAFLSQASPVVVTNPLEKLKVFLLANPDVAEILK